MAFDLNSISKGKAIKAPRVMIYGVHGSGKSTFAASAPNPIVIQTEDGLGSLEVARFPLAKSSGDVVDAIGTLYNEKHDFETVVLDSADWLENILITEIEEKYDKKDLDFGKWTLILAEKWRGILDGFSALRNDKNMCVIIIAHSEIKRYESPETDAYERFQPKLQTRASSLIQEWSDVVGFVGQKTIIRKSEAKGFDKERVRATTTGERILYLTDTPARIGKNRFSMPESISLDWTTFASHIK